VIKLFFIFTIFSVSILGYNDAHSLNQGPQSNLKTGWYYIEDSKNDYLRPLDKSDEQYYVNPDPIITARHFNKVEVQDLKYNGVAKQYLLIRFDSIGKSLWGFATLRSINKKLALIIDDKLVYVGLVNEPITSGVSALNRGIYSRAELEAFADKIKMEM
jgi:preprotein translocase subunit SecD